MKSQPRITLAEEDLQEIFALFSSPADEERTQVYDQASDFYFRRLNLADEYSLNEEKKEFAVDAWRAITYYLYRHGYEITKDGEKYDLGKSSGYSDNGNK
jgi:hypothetical protein